MSVSPLAPVSPRASFAGEARVTYTRLFDKTVLSTLFSTSPLRLLTPNNHGEAAWVFASSFGGGLLGGDSQEIHLTVEQGATALFGTQASTKVYRASSPARQHTELRVDDDALFVGIPDPVTCFRDSRYVQHAHLSLSARASLVWVEAFTSGRASTGERWQAAQIRSRTEMDVGGARTLVEALSLSPETEASSALGRFDAFATIVVQGPRTEPLREELLRVTPLRKRSPLTVATSIKGDAVIARIFGESPEFVAGEVRARLSALPALLGDDPWARKF